ncbi:hypothetical protein DsansV1_C03g0028291 [Dioscorea sansibarensis]
MNPDFKLPMVRGDLVDGEEIFDVTLLRLLLRPVELSNGDEGAFFEVETDTDGLTEGFFAESNFPLSDLCDRRGTGDDFLFSGWVSETVVLELTEGSDARLVSAILFFLRSELERETFLSSVELPSSNRLEAIAGFFSKAEPVLFLRCEFIELAVGLVRVDPGLVARESVVIRLSVLFLRDEVAPEPLATGSTPLGFDNLIAFFTLSAEATGDSIDETKSWHFSARSPPCFLEETSIFKQKSETYTVDLLQAEAFFTSSSMKTYTIAMAKKDLHFRSQSPQTRWTRARATMGSTRNASESSSAALETQRRTRVRKIRKQATLTKIRRKVNPVPN